MKTIFLRGCALLAALLAACGDDSPSKSVPTHEIYPRFAVETDAAGESRVAAEFARYYGPIFTHTVSLSGGDELIVRAAGQEARFNGPGNQFETLLPTGNAADTQFAFDFQRPRREDAPDSVGYLPAPMDLTAPAEGQQYQIATDVMLVTWDSGGTLDDMWLEIDARCEPDEPLRDEFVRIEIQGDPGLHALRLEEHFDGEGCTHFNATVKLVRERDGAIDPAFAPNEEECGDDCDHQERFTLRQVRTVAVRLFR